MDTGARAAWGPRHRVHGSRTHNYTLNGESAHGGDNIMLAMLSFSIPMGAHKFGSFASTFRVLQETILKGGSEITNASR